jgi:hypothetical protein
MRDLYYDLINYYKPGTIPKAPFDNRVKLIFQFGHLTETLLKKVFAYKFGVKFEQERVTYGALTAKDGSFIPLTGSIDWASDLNGTSTLILCDAKSSGDYPFKKAPKPDNIAQMQLYMHSDWARANKVDKAMLIYFNKNTSDIKVIELDYNATLAAQLLQRLQLVYDYYKNETLPPREYVVGIDWEANYSAYKDYDSVEFSVPISKRDTVSVAEEYGRDDKNALRQHVLEYGNKVVTYIDKTIYVTHNEDKLIVNVL